MRTTYKAYQRMIQEIQDYARLLLAEDPRLSGDERRALEHGHLTILGDGSMSYDYEDYCMGCRMGTLTCDIDPENVFCKDPRARLQQKVEAWQERKVREAAEAAAKAVAEQTKAAEAARLKERAEYERLHAIFGKES